MASTVLFDGVCNLCNGAVRYIIARDQPEWFQFASLQSEAGQALLTAHGEKVPTGDPDSIVLIEDGKAFSHSTAALRIARRLSGPSKLLWVFIIVPKPLRDVVYRFVARNRYRWFGKSDACRLPTPQEKKRFLG